MQRNLAILQLALTVSAYEFTLTADDGSYITFDIDFSAFSIPLYIDIPIDPPPQPKFAPAKPVDLTMPDDAAFDTFPNQISNVGFNFWKDKADLTGYFFLAATTGNPLVSGYVLGGKVEFITPPQKGDYFFVCFAYEENEIDECAYALAKTKGKLDYFFSTVNDSMLGLTEGEVFPISARTGSESLEDMDAYTQSYDTASNEWMIYKWNQGPSFAGVGSPWAAGSYTITVGQYNAALGQSAVFQETLILDGASNLAAASIAAIAMIQALF